MIISDPATDPYRSPLAVSIELRRSARNSLLLAILWLGGVGSIYAVSQGRRALDGMQLTGNHTHKKVAMTGYVLGWVGVGISAVGLLALFVYISAVGYGMSTKATYPS